MGGFIPYARPYESGDSIAQLIMRQGQIRADRAQQSGQILGNAVAGLGQTIAGGIQAVQAKKEESKRSLAFDVAIQSGDPTQIIKVLGPKDGPAVVTALKAHTPDGLKQYTDRMVVLRDQARGIKAVPPDKRPAAYRFAVQGMTEAGVLKPGEAPPEYDESIVDQMAAYGTEKKERSLIKGSAGDVFLDPETHQPVASIAPKPEKPPTPGSMEDYMTADPARRKEIEAARKGYMQADDRPRVNVNLPGAEGLNPDAVEYTATQYRILGPGGIPTRIEGPDRVKILNEAAKQAKALGQSPAVAVQRQAAFKSDAASLTKMSTMKSAAESFETKAASQAEIVSDLSKKVSRSQFPLLNSAILAGKSEFGDKNTQLLFNALTTFASEYAKIMEGSTGSVAGSTDSARQAANRLISAKLNNDTLQATLDLMKREMRLTIGGYDATIGHITERMGGAPPAASVPAAAPAAKDPLGLR